MSTMRSQITGVSIVYATFCSGPEQRKHQSSVSPVTGEFPAQKASNAETVSIWWRHHDFTNRENCNNILVSDDFLNMYSRGVFSWRLRRILKAMCAYLKPFTWCMRQPDGCIFLTWSVRTSMSIYICIMHARWPAAWQPLWLRLHVDIGPCELSEAIHTCSRCTTYQLTGVQA